MRPPFKITSKTLALCTEIAKMIGHHKGVSSPTPQPKLRRQNQIKTIHGSLAIEGNTLNLDQVTAILEGRRVVGDPREVLEIRNAIKAYELAHKWNANKESDLLKAHAVMMSGLMPDAGKYRSTNVGIIKGSKVGHVAPKPKFVPKLMSELFAFLKNDHEIPVLVKACLFHYELEFIHPFSDGNGRMGRLWQHVILLSDSPIFTYIPVESVIKERQSAYYQALSESDKAGEATKFIEFALTTIRDSLADLMEQLRARPLTNYDRLDLAFRNFGSKRFSRKDYLNLFKSISTATASRDLLIGVKSGQLNKNGEKALTSYSFAKVKQLGG
jgi:Fic family protein